MTFRSLPHVLLAVAASLTACKSDRPATGAATVSNDAVATPVSSPAATVVTVTASDYKLDLPAKIPAGAVTMHLLNHGKEMHQAQIIRLEEGKTAADFAQLKPDAPPPSWAKFVGGPNGIVPGGKTTATAVLTPGNYLVLCFIPSPDGVPHDRKGMIQPFEVTAGTGAGASALPAAGDTIKLVDYTFESSRPLTPGRHTILVENAGPQAHELVLLQLAPGKTAQDFAKWATTGGMKGPPPAMPVGGVTVIEHGGSGVFTADLAPGDYGLICFVPDAKDGKPHLMHGMVKQITVAAR